MFEPAAHQRPLSRRVAILALLLVGVSLLGCNDEPAERFFTRYDALLDLLEANKDDPDQLLAELGEYVEAHRNEWGADQRAFAALSESKRARTAASQDERTRETMLRLLDVTTEIQDRLRAEPAKLARFLALMREIRL